MSSERRHAVAGRAWWEAEELPASVTAAAPAAGHQELGITEEALLMEVVYGRCQLLLDLRLHHDGQVLLHLLQPSGKDPVPTPLDRCVLSELLLGDLSLQTITSGHGG